MGGRQRPKTIDVVKTDLFSPLDVIQRKYDKVTVARLIRLRAEYEWMLSNPDARDRQFVEEFLAREDCAESQLYADLHLLKQMVPMLATANKDWHRWKTNQMLIETYQMAKKRKDTKTMAVAAAQYAKVNRVDLEDEQSVPYEEIVVQPFVPTSDPTVLGIKPIPNVEQKIKDMIAKYRRESIDIDDVEFEEADVKDIEMMRQPLPPADNG